MPKNNETAVLSIITRVQHSNVEKYRDEVEALEGQKRTLPMSAVSVVQTLECTTGSVGGCGEQKKDSCMKHSRGLSTGERIFISLIP